MTNITNRIYIIIFFQIFCGCNNTNNQSIEKTPLKDSSNIIKDTLGIEKHVTKKTQKINLDSIPVIKYVYVIAKNGITYFKEPDSNSLKIGKLELGTKLGVIEYNNSHSHKTKWAKVISEIDSSDNYWISPGSYKHIGFVSTDFLKDSSEINFLELPVLFNSISSPYAELKEEKLKVYFSKIDLKTFQKYKESFIPKITFDSSMKYDPVEGGSFCIKTKKSNLKFVCGKGFSRPCDIYNGYIESIHSYIIDGFGESVAYQFLLDENNNGMLHLDNYYDGGTGDPILSPLNSKMLTVASCSAHDMQYYECRSRIVLYDLKGINSILDIKKYKVYCSTDWEIVDLIWIDENSFAIVVGDSVSYDSRGKEIIKNKRYYKAIIK